VEVLREAVGWDRMADCYDQILARSYTHFSVTEGTRLIGFVNDNVNAGNCPPRYPSLFDG
jgi:hypothetical protein